MGENDENPQPNKDVKVEVKAPKGMVKDVRKSLRGAWSLSALTRALWAKWLEQGTDLVNPDEIAKHSESAPRGRPKGRSKLKKKD